MNKIKVAKKNGVSVEVHISHYLKYPEAFKALTETEQAKVDKWVKENGEVEPMNQEAKQAAVKDTKLAAEHEKAVKKKAPAPAPKGD